MIKVAKMIRFHLIGILNADVLEVTNARAESLNSKIQRIRMAPLSKPLVSSWG